MDDSDEFGEFDDTEFLAVATQVEQQTAFQSSPRPQKRRRIDHDSQQDERIASVPPRKALRNRRSRPIIESDDEDELHSAPFATSLTPEKKRQSYRGQHCGEDEFDPTPFTTSLRPRAKKRTVIARKENESAEEGDESPGKKWRRTKKDQIHIPTTNLDMNDAFFTQPPQEYSPPWKTRGPIWRKPTTSIGVHRPLDDAAKTVSVPGRQPVVSRPPRSQADPTPPESLEESPKLPTANGETLEYDPAQDLADLPSDAFASSSLSPQKQYNEAILISSGVEPERQTRLVGPQIGLRQTTLFGREGVDGEVPPSQVNKRYNFVASQEEPPTHHKLDPEAMKTWVYPTNLGTIRDYQFNIVARGLFHNLLVALPTGLGKTFIAATIMLNWFRWTKDSQIVFVAPTKPLVSQQVEACFNIAGIPRSQTSLLTGGVPPGLRAEEWASKRVFFMTPQTLLNDLKSGIGDPKKIVLLVVDEAHRATGSYAYVGVVSLMRRFNPSFRILALTATPGADVESVQKVIDGLDISRVEIRTENSLDIRSYVHHRKVEKHVFQNSDVMEMCMELYSQAVQPCVKKLSGLNAFWSNDPLALTPYGCTQARQKWFASDAGRKASFGMKSMVNSIFSILGSLSQSMELLKYHGIGPFYTKLKDFKDSQAESKSKYKKEICESDAFKKLMVRLHTWVTSVNFVGHPKLEYLQEAILDHFVNAAEGRNPDGAPPSQTRIMVFAHFRDSAEEIVKILKRQEPMIRPRVFVGQASAKNSEGMGQKEQLEVIEKFKMGTYNTLVATSIGEEGLDIGEVDLIVCYDSKASPIRMLQRMGRTGRKREGKIILLQMKGKEENDAMKAKDAYEKMQELIANGSKFTFHEEISRRIVPRDVQPVVDRRVVEIPLENSQPELPEPKRRGRVPKRPPKIFHMPDGVITGFVTAGRMDEEIKPRARGKKASPTYPSEEPIPLPPLESVLLNETETKDLECRFQTVFDDDDAPMIGALNLGGDPSRQRIMSRTKFFRRPGRVTERFVKTLRRMHAIDDGRVNELQRNLHHSDHEPDPEINILVSDNPNPEPDAPLWEDDDPPSQPLLKAKATPKHKMKTTLKAPAPRGRPKSATTTPARQAKAKTRTPTYRISDLVDEGASSSPPPTDPRMRLASQAVSLGSDDTINSDPIEDTQAYMMDSDLRSFIADDDDEIELPDSSLPSLDFGLGRGTQAVLKGDKEKKRKRAEKIFTSDPTDDDAIVSSDSDEETVVTSSRKGAGANKRKALIVESDDEESEDEDNEPIVQPKKRVRKVVDDDEDEDEDE
ncbi:P-loop containing nucleoside triphosphate hydrolase protein [Zopfia rhizophila CBS 207.26]|uniref:ATP-dependent DNA helicase n=1 Tax=Zopfia rhizophila CBS 207.26 TaxID=1314779 RepID=A0A6A6EDG2_9PEZI|nr:P-loop containing nucleoside triphosphate hydrolase protein [Zopfia rhizophila CBS 207.26]